MYIDLNIGIYAHYPLDLTHRIISLYLHNFIKSNDDGWFNE